MTLSTAFTNSFHVRHCKQKLFRGSWITLKGTSDPNGVKTAKFFSSRNLFSREERATPSTLFFINTVRDTEILKSGKGKFALFLVHSQQNLRQKQQFKFNFPIFLKSRKDDRHAFHWARYSEERSPVLMVYSLRETPWWFSESSLLGQPFAHHIHCCFTLTISSITHTSNYFALWSTAILDTFLPTPFSMSHTLYSSAEQHPQHHPNHPKRHQPQLFTLWFTWKWSSICFHDKSSKASFRTFLGISE